MPKNIQKSFKFTGVYYSILKDKSKTYYITYNNPQDHKKQWLKIGTSKEGINESYCNNIRLETLSKLRLGDRPDLPMLAKKQKKQSLNDLARL